MLKEIGAILIVTGLIFLLAGGVFYLIGSTGFKLPFDIVIRGKNFVFYFPIGTSILISIILTLLLSLILRSK